jgi:integrase
VTLSEEQEQLLSAAAPDYIRDLLTFDLNTGLRKSDLFGLKWADVDMERRELKIIVKENKKLQVLPLNEAAVAVLERQ